MQFKPDKLSLCVPPFHNGTKTCGLWILVFLATLLTLGKFIFQLRSRKLPKVCQVLVKHKRCRWHSVESTQERVSREKFTKKWTHSGHSRCMRNTNFKIHNLLKWLRLGVQLITGVRQRVISVRNLKILADQNTIIRPYIKENNGQNPIWKKKNNNHKYPHIFALGKFVIL